MKPPDLGAQALKPTPFQSPFSEILIETIRLVGGIAWRINFQSPFSEILIETNYLTMLTSKVVGIFQSPFSEILIETLFLQIMLIV